MPEDLVIQQVLRISQSNVGGSKPADVITKAHILIASCNTELKDLVEYQLPK